MDPQSDDQVVRLLGGLKRVNAPENLESRVKARLSAVPTQSSGFGFLKLAVPTGALAALALFLLLSGYLGREMPSTDVVVAEEKPKATQVAQPKVSQAQDPGVPNERSQAPEETVASGVPEMQPPPPVNSVPLNSSQSVKNRRRSFDTPSYDIGSGANSPEVILPPGFNPKSRPGTDANSEKQMRRPSVPASDLLRYTGVSIELRGNEWVVNSVVQKSPAERIGLKAGDIIISLNEIQFGKATAFPSGVDLKTIRVKRGGSTVVLKF